MTARTPTSGAAVLERIRASVNSDVELRGRLAEAGLSHTPVQFRARQLAVAAGGLAVGAVLAAVAGARPAIMTAGAITAGVATFIGVDFGLTRSIASRNTQITDELPIVAEHIGMLLASGMSLASSLKAAAQRGEGICADGLQRVCARVAGGIATEVALAEWADDTNSAAVRRFVGVLTLHNDAADIGSLVSEEARASRLEAHRRLIARIERRNEQVWIPVTVAALVPGCVLLAIPFSDALGGYALL